MRKTATKLTKVKVNGRRMYCVTWPKTGKGRNRQHFSDKGAAETFLAVKRIEQQNYGTAGMAFTEQQRAEYAQCADVLRPFGKSLADAVAFYLPHLQATNRSCTAAELASELLSAKRADGASERYLVDLRTRLGRFAADFSGKPLAQITATEIDDWLRRLIERTTGAPLAATTRNNFRRILIVAFNFANSRGYCFGNPAEKSAKAKGLQSVVGILTVEQTAQLLEHSPAELVPFLAIGAFAGLRRAELERLDWSNIDTDAGLIEVTAANAKSARRRFVKVSPNLAEWLVSHVRRAGCVAPPNCRKLLEAARTAAGIAEWPQNALRHGFASYHLARFNDAAALALELGHTNSDLVFQHYRQLVKPKEAERYWKICPSGRPDNLVTFPAVG